MEKLVQANVLLVDRSKCSIVPTRKKLSRFVLRWGDQQGLGIMFFSHVI